MVLIRAGGVERGVGGVVRYTYSGGGVGEDMDWMRYMTTEEAGTRWINKK